MHRPAMDWEAAGRRHDPALGRGPAVGRPAPPRRRPPRHPRGPRPGRIEPVWTGNDHVFGLLREHAGERRAAAGQLHAGAAAGPLGRGPRARHAHRRRGGGARRPPAAASRASSSSSSPYQFAWLAGERMGPLRCAAARSSRAARPGLGGACAERLRAEGMHVLIADVAEDAGAEAAARLGERAAFRRTDVTDAAAVDAAVAEAAGPAPGRPAPVTSPARASGPRSGCWAAAARTPSSASPPSSRSTSSGRSCCCAPRRRRWRPTSRSTASAACT